MNLETWTTLAKPEYEALVRAAAAIDHHTPSDVAALRKQWRSAELVHAALQLAQARRKAKIKFPDLADALWADPHGVEMATSSRAGAHKAARFAALGSTETVVDLCSGIGGDAMALSRAGLNVLAVDADPVRAWMTSRNARCSARTGDAASPDLPEGPFHIDPSRRTPDGSRRLFRLADLSPSIEIVRAIVERRGTGAVKLGPGLDTRELPEPSSRSEIEFLSEDGHMTQAIVWTGKLAHETLPRTATLLTRNGTHQLRGTPDESRVIPTSPINEYIFEVDPCVERACLLAELCEQVGAPMVHPALGLVTSASRIDHPMLTPFRVLAAMPWNVRTVRAELSRLNAGIVEVKTRGKAVNPDQEQARLRGDGDRPVVVFVLRFDRSLRAIIAERVSR